MNIKKAAMMLTIMLITILSASSFYVITGEVNSGGIRVNSSSSTIRSGDYEKVYGEGPYTDSGGSYYIRYTGAKSHRTTVDLEDTNVTDQDGKTVDSGLTIENGYPYIFEQKITSTYKMFSYREESGKKYNTEITRVFVPSTIAFPKKGTNGVPIQERTNEGIASNTFEGWSTDTEKDVIYHTGQLINNTTVSSVKYTGSNVTSEYDRTTKISKDENAYPHVTTYVYLGSENVSRDSNCLTGMVSEYTYQYKGDVKNVFVSNSVNYPSAFFARTTGGTYLEYALLDDGTTWSKNMGLAYVFDNQYNLKITSNFQLPKDLYQGNNATYSNNMGLRFMFYGCSSIEQLPDGFKISDGIDNISGMFCGAKKLRGVIEVPDGIKFVNRLNATFSSNDKQSVFYDAGKDVSKNIYGYNSPIVMKYDSTNTVLENYTVNILTTKQSGYVTKVPYTNQTNWKKSCR